VHHEATEALHEVGEERNGVVLDVDGLPDEIRGKVQVIMRYNPLYNVEYITRGGRIKRCDSSCQFRIKVAII
jgi:hypothetical protein